METTYVENMAIHERSMNSAYLAMKMPKIRAGNLHVKRRQQFYFILNNILNVGETGASCIQEQVVSETFYEYIANIWRYHRQWLVGSPPADTHTWRYHRQWFVGSPPADTHTWRYHRLWLVGSPPADTHTLRYHRLWLVGSPPADTHTWRYHRQ